MKESIFMLTIAKTADKSTTCKSVFRICHKEHYTPIGNLTLKSTQLSDFAYRLHLHMLHHSSDFKFYRAQLANHFNKSLRTVQRALTELAKSGLVRYNITGFNEGFYQVFEQSYKDTIPSAYTGVNPELTKAEPLSIKMDSVLPSAEAMPVEPVISPVQEQQESTEQAQPTEPTQPTVSANEENTRAPEEPLFTDEEFDDFFALALAQINRVHTLTKDDEVILETSYSDYMSKLTVAPRLSRITQWLLNGLEDWKDNKRLRAIRRKGKEEKTMAIVRRDIHQAQVIIKDIQGDKVRCNNDRQWAEGEGIKDPGE